jgi:hypothetical protein
MQTATRRNMTRFGTTVAAIVAVAALAIVKLK